MDQKSKIKGHVVTAGGCPFHRSSRAESLPLIRAKAPGRAAAAVSGDNGPVVTDFTRMFSALPASRFDEADIRKLTAPGGPMDIAQAKAAPRDNPRIPAGYTFLGQFIDHDITFDAFSNIHASSDPGSTRDAETPTFDLSNVYGRGPVLDGFLYDSDSATILYGTDKNPQFDVCRNRNGAAIIGDPRNDDNLFVNQIHLALIKFHNQVVADLAPMYSGRGHTALELFERASETVRWHYQWMVVHDFLRRFIGDDLLQNILTNGCQFYTATSLELPIEFSAAAYRMGHATVRQIYQVNQTIKEQQIFDAHQPGAFVPPESRVDWRYFFAIDQGVPPQASQTLDTLLASELLTLPIATIPGYEEAMGADDPLYLSLAGRNILRQNEFALPAGQTIARCLGARVYSNAELGLTDWNSEVAPLWYYVLKEAQLSHDGQFLGDVGGRIVGETFIGIMRSDPTSFLHNEGWRPKYGSGGDFTMADLIKIADAYEPPNK